MFKIVSSTNNLFRYYRTPTSFTTKRLPPQVKLIAEVPYLLIPAKNTFYVYRLENLQLHFMGPMLEGLSSVCFNEYDVFASVKGAIHRIDRGDIASTYQLEGTVSQIIKFGEYVIVRLEDKEILVFEQIRNEKRSTLQVDSEIDEILKPSTSRNGEFQGEESDDDKKAPEQDAFLKEVYRFEVPEKIRLIFHPHSYSNKMLIVYESGKVDIYNVYTKKTIFSFKLEGKIVAVSQTSVLDVLGFVLEDGTVKIFNVKKNKPIFEILNYKNSNLGMTNGKEMQYQLDFKGRLALVIIDGDLMIYDLESKREVFRRAGVYSGLLLNEDLFLVVAAGSVEIYNIDGFALLKKRSMLSGNIRQVESLGQKEVLLVGTDRLFRMNIYKDEQNRFLKNTKNISLLAVREHALTYGEGRLDYYDKEGAFHRFIERKCDWIRTFGQFCFVGYERRCIIMNLKSKRIVVDCSVDEPIIDGDLNNERFAILTGKTVRIFNYQKEELFLHKLENLCISSGEEDEPIAIFKDGHEKVQASEGRTKRSVEFKRIELVNNLCLIQTDKQVVVMCNEIHRSFKAEKYKLGGGGKFLATILDSIFRLYDIHTGKVVDEMEGSVRFRDVVVIDNLKFVGLLDDESNFHLFYNNTFFCRTEDAFLPMNMSDLLLDIQVEKKDCNFDKELAMYKRFGTGSEDLIKGLGKEEVLGLLRLIESNWNDSTSQIVLSRLLRQKNDLIEPSDVKEISKLLEEDWKRNENVLMKVFGYLKISKS